MKILILGLGKSGTTVMVYKISGGLSNCMAFSGGMPGKYVGDYENAVYKHTYEARKGKDFDLYRDHLRRQPYDRKVWMARDPRDAAVSRMLYRWHKGYVGRKKQYRAHLDLVLKKEADPASVPFYEICRFTSHGDWPVSREDVFEEERLRYREMAVFAQGLDKDWFLFTYEDMIEKRFDKLNSYLGFTVAADAEVPHSTGKDKVIRKKATGDWRHWFTQADVELFKPAYEDYMKIISYDVKDWTTAKTPVIEPEFSSGYMQDLTHKATKNIILRYADPLRQRLFHRG